MKKILYILASMVLAASCGLDESTKFETPYFCVATSDGSYSTVIGSDVDNINTYYVYLSSSLQTSDITVTYSISAGSGLKEGVDYSIITTGNTLIFKPGVYRMPIRIRWMPHILTDTANAKITISLDSNDKGITLGVPGPSSLGKVLTLEKKNL